MRVRFQRNRPKIPLGDGRFVCENVFHVFVRNESSVSTDKPIIHRVAPCTPQDTSIELLIYESDNLYPEFVTDHGSKQLARLVMPVPHYGSREVEVRMFFGDSEIKVEAKDQQGKVVQTALSFEP